MMPTAEARSQRRHTILGATVIACLVASTPADAGPPEIRISATNRMPACVTPEKLDAFIRTRNDNLSAKFQGIGALYRKHGEAWRVRWDYAFFQMVIETNYLMFRRADGRQGDVSPRQNNFAGIGATGGGVPGDSYRDVSTGVLAQIQHLVAYSGERMDNPVAPRTQLKQDDIISASLKLRRPVTFADLRNRWAADRNYARSIEAIADRFREQFCTGAPAPAPAEQVAAATSRAPAPQLAVRPSRAVPVKAPQPIAAVRPPAAAPTACRVLTATYGGQKTVLIRAETQGETQFTALTVVDGFERSMIETYLNSRAPGGQPIGEYSTSAAAMARAKELCPGTT